MNEKIERVFPLHDASAGDGQESSGEPVADKTIDNFVEKALRLYEQEPPHRRMKRLGEYTHRWSGWALGFVSGVASPSLIDY